MDSVSILLVVGIVALVLWMLYFIPTYNAFVHLKEDIKNAKRVRKIEADRRAGLWADACGIVEKDIAQGKELARLLREHGSSYYGKLIALVESTPALRANETLKETLRIIDRVRQTLVDAQRTLSETIRQFNILCRRFPSCIVAWMGGFAPMPDDNPDDSRE